MPNYSKWLRGGCALLLLGAAVMVSSRIVGKITGQTPLG